MVTTLERTSPKRVPITGRAAVYVRVSSDRQAENGASLENQREACERYCEEKGLQVVATLQDVESGLHTDRKAYRKALELAGDGSINYLVTWRYDRLGRDSGEFITQLKALRKLGVQMVAVATPTESQFMMGLLGLMAEEESRVLSQRITASKQRRFLAGHWGGVPPFGYDVKKQDGGPVLVPNAHAPIVQKLFEMYASGKCALRDLHRYLMGLGIKKTPYAVNYLLRNRTYLGVVRHGRFSHSPFQPKPEQSEAKGLHEPLVDETTFALVQDRLSKNLNRNRGGPSPKYLFTSLVFCGDCGSRFAGENQPIRDGKRAVVYGCNRRQKGLGCKAHRVYEPRLRQHVVEPLRAVLEALREADVRKAVRAELEREAEAAQNATSNAQAGLMANRERLESRLSRLEDGWLDGHISKERYLERRDQIQAELAEIKAKLALHPAPVATDISGLLAMAETISVKDMDAVSWRDIVEAVVERVEIKGVANKRNAAIVVHWKQGFEAVKAAAEAMS